MGDWILLNVGGTKLLTKWAVLTSQEDSVLAKMFEHGGAMLKRDRDGAFLIDSNPDYFKPILQFLRRGEVIIDPGVNPKGVLLEAKHFKVKSMISRLEAAKITQQKAQSPQDY